jgi:hypothetical protein
MALYQPIAGAIETVVPGVTFRQYIEIVYGCPGATAGVWSVAAMNAYWGLPDAMLY